MTSTAASPTSTAAPAVVARGQRADAPREQPGRSRRRTVVVIAIIVALLGATVLVTQLTRPRVDATPVGPHNPEPDGARAVAQILGQHGVDVTFVTTTAAAIGEAEAGSTLLVVEPGSLRPEQQQAVAGVEADIVLAGIDGRDLSALTDRITATEYVSRAQFRAGCGDDDAQAAQAIVAGGPLLTGDVDETCFGTADGGLYARWTQDEQVWRALSDVSPLTNAALATDGNAALVLRALGAHERLVWYVPDPDDTFGQAGPEPLFPLPGPVVLQLFLVGLVLVLWRGRRLGPVVVEPLPVIVRATETTRGRGRLYRRARAHAHAAGALRAGLLARVAGRVGLPTHAAPAEIVETLARASGRDHQAIHDVLYGPPPTDDEGLVALTHALDTLESEVQRR